MQRRTPEQLESRCLLAATIIDTNFPSGVPSNAQIYGSTYYRSANTDIVLTRELGSGGDAAAKGGTTGGQQGSIIINSSGARALAFNAALRVYAGGDSSGGDGYSFGYGSLSNASFGEAGVSSGVWISVDTNINGSANGAIRAYYDGVLKRQDLFTGTSRALLAPDGTRSLNFSVTESGELRYSHTALTEKVVQLGGSWAPQSEWRFGVGARTGAAVDAHIVAELHIFDTTPNHAPTNVGITSSGVAENSSNATIGTLSTTDQDEFNTFSYSLVSGAGDNSSFQIVGTSLRTAVALNYEAGSTRSVVVRTTDQGGLTFDKTFTVNVSNVNEAPTNIALSNSGVVENQSFATIGVFSTSDPDSGNSFTYALASGAGSTDNARFQIVGSSLKINVGLNHEESSTRSVRIRSTDQGGFPVEKIFIINVLNVNETPTALILSSATIAENNLADADIGTFSSSDPDAGDTFAYSLVTGTGDTDNAVFTINSNSLKANAAFDFEARNNYSIRVRTTDANGLAFDQIFTISVTNVNETPTELNLSSATIAENNLADADIGTFSSSDPDAGDTFAYSLVAGTGDTDNAVFTINSNSLKANAAFDFEARSSYSIRVCTTDQDGLTFEKAFTITVDDVQEDVSPPASSVTGAALNLGSGLYDVHVVYSDPSGLPGSTVAGVQFVDVYYRVNPGSPGSVAQLLGRIAVVPVSASGTATISAALNVQPGNIVQFWSVATDAALNIEAEVTPRTDFSFVIADTVGPVTQVNTAVFDGSGFIDLTFSGTDVGGGNIASVEVYVETDPGSGVSSISRIVTVSGGRTSITGSTRLALPHDGLSHSYRFFSIGTDHLGNREGGSGTFSGDPGPGGDVILTNITVTVPVLPEVTGFDVNAGLANRSSVQTADLLFNDQAFIDDLLLSLNDGNSANDRVVLERLDLAGNSIGGGQFVPVTASRDGLKLSLTFGATGLQQNGVYAIRVDMDGNTANGFETTRKFHRLLGDVNGDGKVDVVDSNKTRAAYANPALHRDGDVDGDRDVDAGDISFFTKFLRATTGDKQLQLSRNLLDD